MRFYFEHFRSICIFFVFVLFVFFSSFARSSFYSAKWAGRASVQCANERINKRTNKRNKLPHLYSAKQTLLCIILILCWSWIFFGDVSLFLQLLLLYFYSCFSFLIGIVVSIPIWFNKLCLSFSVCVCLCKHSHEHFCSRSNSIHILSQWLACSFGIEFFFSLSAVFLFLFGCQVQSLIVCASECMKSMHRLVPVVWCVQTESRSTSVAAAASHWAN